MARFHIDVYRLGNNIVLQQRVPQSGSPEYVTGNEEKVMIPNTAPATHIAEAISHLLDHPFTPEWHKAIWDKWNARPSSP